MKVLGLNGQWNYQREGGGESGQATVPGDIYKDLLDSGQIPDPFYRDNEESLQWIGESDWSFERYFDVPEDLLKHDRVLLRCGGLDTLATVCLNDKVLAETDNMFRTYEWEVKGFLKIGENRIRVDFASAVNFCDEAYLKQNKREYPGKGKIYATDASWLRKEQCNFGWDWGVKTSTCGIWKDIDLIAFDTARLREVAVVQDHSRPEEVDLCVTAEVESIGNANLRARVSVRFHDTDVGNAEKAVQEGAATVKLNLSNPQLWWPNNLGAQPLYRVVVELVNDHGAVLDVISRRIGLRTLRLDRHPDEWGESFQFVVNGVPFFAKGANWIPADAIQSRMTPDRYRELLEDTTVANMNMLRVWGGGIYEDSSFYDLCDELGICVWQDFMFGHGHHYPVESETFRENVGIEARQQVKRLRHHPCIALWCGNNELEQGAVKPKASGPAEMAWSDYGILFDERLPNIVSELHPDCDYWPSSPHTPQGDRAEFNDPASGDAHLWEVWHGGMPFEWYRTCEHRFNSEFGFQSLPEPKTTYAYTEEKDRNIVSFVMEQHQRSHGNGRIMDYLLGWFMAPNSFENTLWLSQILQGMSIKYACEHWRRMMPRGMGTLYWQLNDCWPVASWSSIDYYGRWKALHYMAKRFFAPLMVSGVEDVAEGKVDIHVTSDGLDPVMAELKWVVTDIDGNHLREGGEGVEIPPGQNTRVDTLELIDLTEVHEKRGVLVWLELEAPGQPVSRNLVFFARPVKRRRIFSPRPKHLDLSRNPGINAEATQLENGAFDVVLTTRRPALWVWLELDELDAKCSDNFFHLRPGAPIPIQVKPQKEISKDVFLKQLAVRSLVDTFR